MPKIIKTDIARGIIYDGSREDAVILERKIAQPISR